jgi:transposase
VRFPDGRPHYTKLARWLIRLGIEVKYSRPSHPQSKGKNERFNGTLKAELLRFERFPDQACADRRLAEWRKRYNTIRPHEALDMDTPASHYQPSPVKFPERLPAVEYGPDDPTRKVSAKGRISFQGQLFRVGKAFEGQRVAVRASSHRKQYKVYFCNQHIRTINLDQ